MALYCVSNVQMMNAGCSDPLVSYINNESKSAFTIICISLWYIP